MTFDGLSNRELADRKRRKIKEIKRLADRGGYRILARGGKIFRKKKS